MNIARGSTGRNMERHRKNKENKPGNSSIANIFKVKKCLFDLHNKNAESSSPSPSLQSLKLSSPLTQALALEDSPYSLFKVRKKITAHRPKIINCSDFSPFGSIVTTPTNKKCPEKDVNEKVQTYDSLQSPSHVKLAVQKSVLNPNLIGDFTKPCTLQTIRGKHPDLQSISPETVAFLLQGSENTIYSLIDCRYPYEFDAGHIKTACNIYIKDDIEKMLLSKSKVLEKRGMMQVLIFYCEFSSERGPSMLRHLRSLDRDMNRDCYPFLHYPELYVVEGGYKAFFSTFKELCDPPQYKTMLDQDYTEELALYRSKCKSLSRRSKHSKRARSSLLF